MAFGDDAATTAGEVSYTSPDLTWTGDLAPGQGATITFSVTVDSADTGDQITPSPYSATQHLPASGPRPPAPPRSPS